MLAVIFGATSAVFFGAADFLGGLAAKRISAMLVTGIAATAGVIALTAASPFDRGVWYLDTTLMGVATGVTSCLGIWLLYSAYAASPMTTLAPVVAIVSTVVPMAAGLLTGETFTPLGWAAVAVGLAAIALVAAAPDRRTSRARPIDVGKAALAGAFLGVFYIYLDLTPLDSGLTPITANRMACAVLAFAIVGALALRRGARRGATGGTRTGRGASTAPDATGQTGPTGPGRAARLPVAVGASRGEPVALATAPASARVSGPAESGDLDRVRVRRRFIAVAVGMSLVSGTFDATANTLFLVGLGAGDLAVLSVVSGFYPAVTIALAFIVLRERPNRLQAVGIVLALLALVGMSLA